MASDSTSYTALAAGAVGVAGFLLWHHVRSQAKPAAKKAASKAGSKAGASDSKFTETPKIIPADYTHCKFNTRIIHVGQSPDTTTGAVTVPLSLASTFAQPTPGVAAGSHHHHSYYKGYEYSRTNNPTRAAFEQAVANAEGAAHAIAYSSGSAATSAVIHMLNSGDHVVSIDDVYGGTQRYFRTVVKPSNNIDFTFVDLTKAELLEAAIIPGRTKLVWLETPTNPLLKISDIAAIAAITKKHGVMLAVDNTFMSPYFQNPLAHGADIAVTSVTKFVNGHSDVVMGFCATNSDKINDALRYIQNGIGSVPAPFDCYMALRGFKTLAVRMDRHQHNATILAKFLEAHANVERVVYPGLESHPQHAIAKKQMSGFGGMITFFIKGGLEGARVFLEEIHVFTLAESLGAVESLAECPAIMTHASVPAETREKLGLSDNLIRLSVGIEDIEDLLADMEQALAKAAEATGTA